MSENNSNWEVKDHEVKIGTEWKSASQLRKSFILTALLAVALAFLTIYMFTISLIGGVVILLVCGAVMLISMGSVDALSALDEKLIPAGESSVKEHTSKFKENLSQLKNKAKSKIHKESIESSQVQEPESEEIISIPEQEEVEGTVIIEKAVLVGNSKEETQSLLQELQVDDTLSLQDDLTLLNAKNEYVGKLNKKVSVQVNDITSDEKTLYAKVIETSKSKDDKVIITVSITAK